MIKKQRQINLLIIDDSAIDRQASTILFQQCCHVHVVTASNAKQALNMASVLFDLVITDIEMPEMRGDQLARILSNRFPYMPVVGITSTDSAELNKSKIDRKAFCQLLKKPLNPETCRHLIQDWVIKKSRPKLT